MLKCLPAGQAGNFKRMCRMRGIKKPYSFFIKLGISHTIASHMATDKLNKILLRHLQDSCLELNCTPNDLLDWVPDNKKPARPDGSDHSGGQDTPDTALYALKKGDKANDAAELLSRLPASKLEELAKMLREEKG